MAEKAKIFIKNGDLLVPFSIYKCAFCNCDIPESFPKEKITNCDFCCGECAFKKGIINEKEYIKKYLYSIEIDSLRACVKDEEIHITTLKFPWEKTTRDRDCKEYSEWRSTVFIRDDYTCVNCGQVGGRLNAHHIKEYAKYPELRYEVNNGVTLCEKCHREVHKKGGMTYSRA